MELDFAVLADGVTQRPDGKIDIFGAGLDTIWTPAVPARHPRLTFAVRFLVSTHEAENPHRLELILQGADGAEIARGHADFPPLDEQARAELPPGRPAGLALVVNFDNLVFPEYGNYHLAIHWDGNEARTPLRLFVQPPQSA